MAIEVLNDTRGQAYALEGLFVVTLLTTIILVVAPGISTPIYTEAPEEREFENEVGDEIKVALERSHEDGSLKQNLLAWEDGQEEFDRDLGPVDTEEGYYVVPADGTYPSTAFGDRLSEIKDRHDVDMNVYIRPVSTNEPTETGTVERPPKEKFILRATPPADTFSATTTVLLYETDQFNLPASVYSQDVRSVPRSTQGGEEIVDNENYPIEQADSSEDQLVYNAIEVKIVAWEA